MQVHSVNLPADRTDQRRRPASGRRLRASDRSRRARCRRECVACSWAKRCRGARSQAAGQVAELGVPVRCPCCASAAWSRSHSRSTSNPCRWECPSRSTGEGRRLARVSGPPSSSRGFVAFAVRFRRIRGPRAEPGRLRGAEARRDRRCGATTGRLRLCRAREKRWPWWSASD